jgi:C-terminal binding protein
MDKLVMSKPLVAVVDWKPEPRGDKKCRVEKEAIGDMAHVKYFLCDKEEDWKGQVLKADAILLWHNTRMPQEVINKLEDCKCIIRNGTGFDTVDVAAATCRDIPVYNVPDYGTDEVADQSIALALALCRQIIPNHEHCKDLGWDVQNKSKIRRFKDMYFGVIGLGRIGSSVALKAKALGFKTYFYDPYIPDGVDKSLNLKRCEKLNDLIDNMDVISINCPLTDETHHMIAHKQINRMRSNAFLVNTARGPIIKKDDLFRALRKGKLGGAALDVIEDEPLKAVEEGETPNLIVTPHCGFYSVESFREMKFKAASTAYGVLRGFTSPKNCINYKMLPRHFRK